MLLAQGQIYAKNTAFDVPIDCFMFARYCGKMYSCHLFRTVDCPHLKAHAMFTLEADTVLQKGLACSVV